MNPNLEVFAAKIVSRRRVGSFVPVSYYFIYLLFSLFGEFFLLSIGALINPLFKSKYDPEKLY